MRVVVFFSVILFLMGCVPPQLISSPSTQTLKQNSQTLKVDSSSLENLSLGSQIKVRDPAFPNGLQVIVGQEFFSALAQQCYRVRVLNVSESYGVAALCKGKAGTWIFAPSVQSNHGGR